MTEVGDKKSAKAKTIEFIESRGSGQELFKALREYANGRLWSKLTQMESRLRLPWSEEPGLFPFPGAPPQTLYHYTDIQGLRGIVESNTLRASAAYYLNDSSEIEYGCRLLRRELQPWLRANKGRHFVAPYVLRALHTLFAFSRLPRSLNIFVACFCERDNLLSQWRTYGQKGGYALGFRGTMDAELRAAAPFALKLVKVIYSRESQIQRIRSVLREAILDVESEFGQNPAPSGDLVNEIVMMVQELLLDEIVTFKHPAFLDEREWRLVARFDFRHIPVPTETSSSRGGALFQFRSSAGYVVPFIELSPKSDKIPLTSIRFGPSLDFRRYEAPMRLFLAQQGVPGVQISGSGLPVIL